MNAFHYTDQVGWNAIRAQPAWLFAAHQPLDINRPFGAYFTDLEPTPTNMRLLHQKIRVPKKKQEYVFWYTGTQGLTRLNQARGRDQYIYFSPTDYVVDKPRQKGHGRTVEIQTEAFP